MDRYDVEAQAALLGRLLVAGDVTVEGPMLRVESVVELTAAELPLARALKLAADVARERPATLDQAREALRRG